MHRLEARRIFLTTVFLHYSGKDSFSHLMLQFTILNERSEYNFKIAQFSGIFGLFFQINLVTLSDREYKFQSYFATLAKLQNKNFPGEKQSQFFARLEIIRKM